MDLDALKKLEQEATPLPWKHWYANGSGQWVVRGEQESLDHGHVVVGPQMTLHDARLIAATRNALPQLIETAEAYEKLKAAWADLRDKVGVSAMEKHPPMDWRKLELVLDGMFHRHMSGGSESD